MDKLYSQSNVEAMIMSVYSNKEIINGMLKTAAENERSINKRLSEYSLKGGIVESESIDMYRAYSEEKENMKDAVEEYKNELFDSCRLVSAELCRSDGNYSVLHSVLDKLNTLQIKIMEMLCGLIGRADKLLGCI